MTARRRQIRAKREDATRIDDRTTGPAQRNLPGDDKGKTLHFR
jgi:hypothetical protein